MAQDTSLDLTKTRSFERWKTKLFRHAHLKDFERTESLPEGIHAISQQNQAPIDIYINIRKGKPLFVFFQGAVNSRTDKFKLPFFAGFGVTSGCDASFVSVSDPTLCISDDLTLAWYAGSKVSPTQEILPSILEVIIRLAKPSNIAFVGTSGGGFATLYYSRMMPKTLAIAVNPQTNILKYSQEPVARYAKEGFGIESFKAAKSQLPLKIHADLCSLYEAGHTNSILYLQNQSDWHVNRHCKPFFEALGHTIYNTLGGTSFEPGLYLYLGQWGKGHIAPPKHMLKSLLEQLCAHEGDWSSFLNDEGIRPIFSREPRYETPQSIPTDGTQQAVTPTVATASTAPPPRVPITDGATATERIKHVSLTLENDRTLKAEISHSGGDDLQFAFYLFKDKRRLHIQRYSSDPKFTFECDKKGSYYVAGFAKNVAGKAQSMRSSVVLVTL
ncbi:hypothetical protein [Bordetella petrii]|uniref:hypothetical protein n=1 Tax=Bordetella petrii TaxID=94624 RepID=UPI001E5EA32F|nr:hypothetical protein [Bordetella petrii]MCD0501722.1 hypothetical protein [Bordetella petrii]